MKKKKNVAETAAKHEREKFRKINDSRLLKVENVAR